MTFKDLREKSGRTLAEIAEQLSIKEATYRKYECSARLPAASILTQLPEILNCESEKVLQAYQFHKEVQLKRYGKTNP